MYWGINYKCSVPIASTGFSVLLASFSVYREKGINQYTVTEGLPGVLGNKGTLAKYRREQENITKFEKLQYENIRKMCGNMGTGQFWKGTRPETRTRQGDPRYRVFSIKRPRR